MFVYRWSGTSSYFTLIRNTLLDNKKLDKSKESEWLTNIRKKEYDAKKDADC